MSMSVCLYVYMVIVLTSCPWRVKEDIRFPKIGIGGCEPL